MVDTVTAKIKQKLLWYVCVRARLYGINTVILAISNIRERERDTQIGRQLCAVYIEHFVKDLFILCI